MYISFVDEHGLVSSQYFEAHMKAKSENIIWISQYPKDAYFSCVESDYDT